MNCYKKIILLFDYKRSAPSPKRFGGCFRSVQYGRVLFDCYLNVFGLSDLALAIEILIDIYEYPLGSSVEFLD